ncbi:MAG: Gfo/Idh/MocA family oxidoreductase [Rhodothermales bacterium]|nr:Gfo/Idh/MocA family oxidoreductase [Rhodothermales bacterium]
MSGSKTSRRRFLKTSAAAAAGAAGAAPFLFGREAEVLAARAPRPTAPSDTVQIALIGAGIIGFIDTDTALRVPGTRLVAAADLYDGRLERVHEVYGSDVAVTRDYREILARDDVDAVLVCVPDHWHARIALDALEAGTAVYLEKPMVHDLDEGPQLVAAQERTGLPLQVGSQFASSILYDKARDLYRDGAIGILNVVEASYNRNSAIGAWQYSIPPDASPSRIDWDAFLGDAPRHPFDPVRFFRWRNYSDYGTGVAGDLFVHLFTGIHHTLTAIGPTEVYANGGVRFWKDGRDAPDVHLGLFEYPETEHHPPFSLALQSNFAHGGGGGSYFRFIGDEGMIMVDGNGLTLTRNPRREPPLEAIVEGYNSVRTFPADVRARFVEEYRAAHPVPEPTRTDETRSFTVPRGYDDRLDHFMYFFDSVREGTPVYEDAVFGYRAAAPSLMANLSYRDKKVYRWDPESMTVRT